MILFSVILEALGVLAVALAILNTYCIIVSTQSGSVEEVSCQSSATLLSPPKRSSKG